MQKYKVKLVGVAPIMFHNERLANPMDPFTRELKKLTDKSRGKNKSDELTVEIQKLEWRAGFYEHEGRVCVPAANVIACLKEGAKKIKKGKDVSSGVFSETAFFPLEYEGPKTIEGLWQDGKFLDYRCVGVQQRRVMRARPVFRQWALSIELSYDPEIMPPDDLAHAMQIAGERAGLCEHRPQYGRFVVE